MQMDNVFKSEACFPSPPTTAVLDTDWTKCVLCQHDKNEKLLCRANLKKQGSVGAGYISLAENVTAFCDAGCLMVTVWKQHCNGTQQSSTRKC